MLIIKAHLIYEKNLISYTLGEKDNTGSLKAIRAFISTWKHGSYFDLPVVLYLKNISKH